MSAKSQSCKQIRQIDTFWSGYLGPTIPNQNPPIPNDMKPLIPLSTATLIPMLAVFIILMTGINTWSQEKGWRPVTPEELQLKTPKVEAGADAEAIFWEVRVDDEFSRNGFQTILQHYVRIKVFTERGRDENSKVDLYFGKTSDYGVNISVKDIFARTIKPDGSMLELTPSGIFEREILKSRGTKFQAKSFVLPGVTLGSIVEYRWKEIRQNYLSHYVRLMFSREIPVQFVKYYIKPAAVSLAMRLYSNNTTAGYVKEANGFYSTTMQNVPAFKEEPFMTSEYEVRPWILVYYEGRGDLAPAEQYWRDYGKDTWKSHESWLAFNERITRAATEAVGTPTDSIEDVRKIFEYCRKMIVNVDDDALGLTPEQKKQLKMNRNPSDVLSQGKGTAHDIKMLFGSMLSSTGVDVRVANVSLRTESRFERGLANGFFIRTELIAAKIGEVWQFFDPSDRYIGFGSVPWYEEGQSALVSDPNSPFFVSTPVTPPEKSKQKRIANLRLNDDGSVEGDVRVEYTGHLGRSYKEIYDTYSLAAHKTAVTDMIKKQMLDQAEITSVLIENAKDPERPLAYAYHIRIPSYAETTGKRLIFIPNIFEQNSQSKFVKSERRYNVAFDYAWSEDDEINVELPSGFAAESVAPPHRISRGNESLDISIDLLADGTKLKYARSLVFGRNGDLDFGLARYQSIKQFFDSIHTADIHNIMFLRVSK